MRRLLLLSFSLLLFEISLLGQSLQIAQVDNSTYTGKAMFGYQGWFAHPQDQSPRPTYWHWGNMDQIGIGPLEVEMFPDLREFCPEEKYPTAYTLPNGDTARVFSSGNKQTVNRHIKWVRDYQTDGVFLQRFISEYGDPVVMEFRDSVTVSVMEASEQYGRVFAIMYDGLTRPIQDLKTDWMHLVDDLGILESDRYLQHEGRPLVALWGYTFYETATVQELENLIDWFHNTAPPKYRASIKLGLNDNWFNLDQAWRDAFAKVEVISPWSVGRFNDSPSYNSYLQNQLLAGKSWCDSLNILFVPVLFPGFSWHNLKEGAPQNEIPRNGGDFFWMQAHGAVNNNMESMYFAMLDEVDEGTAFFKVAENAAQAPAQGYWLNLDADGVNLPSDWYLRCAGKAAETLRGNIPSGPNLGIPDPGIMRILPDEQNCGLQFIFPDFSNSDTLEISLDGGLSFPYITADNVDTFTISGLSSNSYEIFVRYPNSAAIAMGNACVDCSRTPLDKAQGLSTLIIFPNPTNSHLYLEGIKGLVNIRMIDLTGKEYFHFSSTESQISLEISQLSEGLYILMIRQDRRWQAEKILIQK